MLRTSPVLPLQVQYQDWLGPSDQAADQATLIGGEVALAAARATGVRNRTASTDKKPALLVAGGPAGSGKTRIGYEVVRMWEDGATRRLLARTDGAVVSMLPLFLDLSNGLGFDEAVDVDLKRLRGASVCLGARLAAAALGRTLASVFYLNGNSLDGLEVENVLEVLVVRCRNQTMASKDDVLLIALHVDEYQTFLRELPSSPEAPSVDFVKRMLKKVGDFMRSARVQARLGMKSVLFPVLTGTPYLGPDILWTEWLQTKQLKPARVDEDGALSIMADVFLQSSAFVGQRTAVLAWLSASPSAMAAISDTGFRPRLVVGLALCARDRAEADVAKRGVARGLAGINWQSALDTVDIADARQESVSLRVVRLALLRIPVRFVFGEGEGPQTASECDVQIAESRGEVELVSVPAALPLAGISLAGQSLGDYRLVRLPFVQLLAWGGNNYLPPCVREVPRFGWASVEQELYVAYLLAARLTHWAKEQESVAVGDLFPGALGSTVARGVRCTPQDIYGVKHEQRKFLRNSAHRPDKIMTVVARASGEGADEMNGDDAMGTYAVDGGAAGDIAAQMVTDGPPDAKNTVDNREFGRHSVNRNVLLACAGNYLIDCRTSAPLSVGNIAANGANSSHVHLVLQAKQTRARRTVSVQAIEDWLTKARRSMKNWATDGDKVIFVLVLDILPSKKTMKMLYTEEFYKKHKDVLVVTKNELHMYLPEALLSRTL